MQEFRELFTRSVYEIASVAVVLLAAVLLSQGLKRLVNMLRDLGHLSPPLAVRLHAVRRWTIAVLVVLVLLEVLGVFRGAWAVISTALAALALGFVAAWSVLSNATAALLILFFRPFRIGDEVEMVELTNGYAMGGRVLDMNLLYVTLAESETQREPAGAPHAPALPGTQAAAPPADAAGPARLVRVPNNLFFQRPMRTRSRYAPGSKAPFFVDPG